MVEVEEPETDSRMLGLTVALDDEEPELVLLVPVAPEAFGDAAKNRNLLSIS